LKVKRPGGNFHESKKGGEEGCPLGKHPEKLCPFMVKRGKSKSFARPKPLSRESPKKGLI